MNTFKRKSLYAAVLAGLGTVGVVGTAQAVHINPDGLGQALIYPYYTVRSDGGNAYDTYLTVVNTTASTKAVKVRFLEGKNSREVLDFNLYLSPNDVWTAIIEATTDGARMRTADRSCVTPTVPATGFPFVNFAYSGGSATDNETGSLDRTREGYFEIIEMGDMTGTITTAIKHVGTPATPPNCAAITNAAAFAATVAGSGGLAGTATLINVRNGVDYGYNAIALDDFSDIPLWFEPGDILPNLTQVNPKVSNVFRTSATAPAVVTSTWSGGPPLFLTVNNADPVTAVFMRDNIINEFVLDSQTLSGTDWVVTMPTKTFYVGVDPVVSGVRANTTAQRPFQRNFGLGGACDDFGISVFDREESFVSPTLQVSPRPPAQVNSFCWEANVLTFNDSNILGSSNKVNVPTPFQNGWARINFAVVTTPVGARHTMTSNDGDTYIGLPVVGFMVQDFVNGTLTGTTGSVLSNYGGLFDHKFTRNITP